MNFDERLSQVRDAIARILTSGLTEAEERQLYARASQLLDECKAQLDEMKGGAEEIGA